MGICGVCGGLWVLVTPVDLKKSSMAAEDGWFYFKLSLQFLPHINHRKKCVDLRQTFFEFIELLKDI